MTLRRQKGKERWLSFSSQRPYGAVPQMLSVVPVFILSIPASAVAHMEEGGRCCWCTGRRRWSEIEECRGRARGHRVLRRIQVEEAVIGTTCHGHGHVAHGARRPWHVCVRHCWGRRRRRRRSEPRHGPYRRGRHLRIRGGLSSSRASAAPPAPAASLGGGPHGDAVVFEVGPHPRVVNVIPVDIERHVVTIVVAFLYIVDSLLLDSQLPKWMCPAGVFHETKG